MLPRLVAQQSGGAPPFTGDVGSAGTIGVATHSIRLTGDAAFPTGDAAFPTGDATHAAVAAAVTAVVAATSLSALSGLAGLAALATHAAAVATVTRLCPLSGLATLATHATAGILTNRIIADLTTLTRFCGDVTFTAVVRFAAADASGRRHRAGARGIARGGVPPRH